jgi:hypothetical protein
MTLMDRAGGGPRGAIYQQDLTARKLAHGKAKVKSSEQLLTRYRRGQAV